MSDKSFVLFDFDGFDEFSRDGWWLMDVDKKDCEKNKKLTTEVV